MINNTHILLHFPKILNWKNKVYNIQDTTFNVRTLRFRYVHNFHSILWLLVQKRGVFTYHNPLKGALLLDYPLAFPGVPETRHEPTTSPHGGARECADPWFHCRRKSDLSPSAAREMHTRTIWTMPPGARKRRDGRTRNVPFGTISD